MAAMKETPADEQAEGDLDWQQSQDEAKARLQHAEQVYARAFDECMTQCKGNAVEACEVLLRRAFLERELASAIIFSHVSLTLEGLGRIAAADKPARQH